MLHERREIEVAEYLLCSCLDGLGNLGGLIDVMRYLSHLGNEQVVRPRVSSRPVQAWEDLGRISGNKPGQVF